MDAIYAALQGFIGGAVIGVASEKIVNMIDLKTVGITADSNSTVGLVLGLALQTCAITGGLVLCTNAMPDITGDFAAVALFTLALGSTVPVMVGKIQTLANRITTSSFQADVTTPSSSTA